MGSIRWSRWIHKKQEKEAELLSQVLNAATNPEEGRLDEILTIIRKDKQQKLEIWRRSILKKLFGRAKISEGEWKRCTNTSVMDL